MGQVLHVWAEGDLDSVGSVWVGYGSNATSGTSETLARVKLGVAGTVSKLSILVADTGGVGRIFKTRVNGADGNLIVTIPDSSTGLFAQDTPSNTDSVAATDLVCFKNVVTSGGHKPPWAKVLFSATGGHGGVYGGYVDSGIGTAASTTYYFTPIARIHIGTTEANAQVTARAAGILKGIGIFASTARTTDTILKTRINGADGAQSLTITASVNNTAYFNNSNSDTISDGTQWCFALVNGTGSSTPDWRTPYVCFDNSSSGVAKNDLFANDNSRASYTAAGPKYYVINGRFQAAANQANAKIKHDFPVTTSRYRMYVSANSLAADATLTVQKNGTDATQTLTITAGLANHLFEDSSHTDAFGATDDINIKIIGGTSGVITPEWTGITELDTTGAGGGFNPGWAYRATRTIGGIF